MLLSVGIRGAMPSYHVMQSIGMHESVPARLCKATPTNRLLFVVQISVIIIGTQLLYKS